MNLLLIAEIREGCPMPDFGAEWQARMESKRHPAVRAASLTAWHLLELGFQNLGIEKLPQVRFEETGKPVFADSPLHFSISHSGNFAAALLSDVPCAVDVEMIRNEMRDKLSDRCLNERERALGCDFFECWTKKECIGKLSGKGLPARPAETDSLDAAYAAHFHSYRITDTDKQEYVLTALCTCGEEPHIQKIGPETL